MQISITTPNRATAIIAFIILAALALPFMLIGAIIALSGALLIAAGPIIINALMWMCYPIMQLGVAWANRVLPDPETLD